MFNKSDIESLMLFNKLNIPSGKVMPDIEFFWFNAVDSKKNRHIMSQRVHHHTFFEIHFIISGEIFYKINEKILTLKRDNYIIIPPNHKHKICGYSDDFVKLSLAFSFSEFHALYDAILKRSNICIKTPSEIIENIIFILNRLKKEYKPYMFIIHSRILEIIYFLAGNFFSDYDIQTEKNETDDRVYKAKKFIQDNIDMHLSCKDVANYCHLSEKQIHRIFFKYENKSVLNYIHEQKIKKIQQYLCDNTKSLKQISVELGFTNEYYFNSFFKKYTGMTPGDYRRALPNKSI